MRSSRYPARLPFFVALCLTLLPTANRIEATTYTVYPSSDIQAAVDLLQPNDTLLFADGNYYLDELTISNKASTWKNRIRLKAINPGQASLRCVWREAAEGTLEWTHIGNGVYRSNTTWQYSAFLGTWNGKPLHFIQDTADLKDLTIVVPDGHGFYSVPTEIAIPGYGYSQIGGYVYVRLPNDLDPNGESILFGAQKGVWDKWGTGINTPGMIYVVNAPGVTFDGFHFYAGRKAIDFDDASPNGVVRNCLFESVGTCVDPASHTVVEWCEYYQQGLLDYAVEHYALNGENSYWPMVKAYPETQEGSPRPQGLLTSIRPLNGLPVLHCEVRNNYVHEVFDGDQIGTSEFGIAHHNVYANVMDNASELETSGNCDSAYGRELRFHHNLVYGRTKSPMGFENQNSRNPMRGPVYIHNNVFDIGWDNVTGEVLTRFDNFLKCDNGLLTAHIYHNLMMENTRRGVLRNSLNQDTVAFRNNIVVIDGGQTETGINAWYWPSQDYNIFARGAPDSLRPNDRYFADESLLLWADLQNYDYALTPSSPAVNVGAVLNVPGIQLNVTDGAPDVGPFELGETMGADWPRPASRVFQPESPLAPDDNFAFDFGIGAIKQGYTGVMHWETYLAGTGYGWESIVSSFGANGETDALKGDGISMQQSTTVFKLDLPNGTYAVEIGTGRPDIATSTEILAEGALMGSTVNAAGEYKTIGFTVTISDGQLNISLSPYNPGDWWAIGYMTVAPSGAATQYTLSTSAVNGSISLSPPGGSYDEGTVVTVTATPNSGYQFDNFSGDLSGSSNPQTITMNANKSITANFSAIAGGGGSSWTINPSDDAYVKGGTNGALNYGNDPVLQVKYNNNPEYRRYAYLKFNLAGVSGTVTGAKLRLYVSQTDAQEDSVFAVSNDSWDESTITYDTRPVAGAKLTSLPVGAAGTWMEFDVTSQVSAELAGDGVISLMIGTHHGSNTAEYSSKEAGATVDPELVVVTNGGAPTQYTLSTSAANGSISLSPAGGTYDEGTVVTVTATPNSGYQFDNFSGDLSGSTNPQTITMSLNKSVTANFSAVCTAPSITAHPANQTVSEGGTATFSVSAAGSAPLSCQWRKDGVDIAGATSASYTTPTLSTADNGSTYRCVVTNGCGTVASNAATLTVNASGGGATYFFDFGSGPLAAGYVGITSSSSYNTTNGYGFTSINTSTDKDFVDGSDVDRDLVKMTNGTFVVDVANGTYSVSVRVGCDEKVTEAQVTAESTYLGQTVNAKNVWTNISGTVTVADGQLTIYLEEVAAGNKAWVNGIEIVQQ